jgi:hypothetical protein
MTLVQKLDGSSIDLDQYGIRTKDFIVGSPAPEHTMEPIPGMPGLVDLGTEEGPREITCLFKFDAEDTIDFARIRDEVFDIFRGTEPFYLIEKRKPGQRWLVKTASSYTIPQTYVYGNFEVAFTAFTGYAESLGTNLQSVTYRHLDLPVGPNDYRNIRATRFQVYNPGKPIDPRSIHDHLRISMRGQSSNLQIRNLTTGDVWRYNGSSNENQTLTIDGIRSTKSGLSIYRDTNKKLISLAHGWNDLEISGSPNGQRKAVQANMPRRKMDDSERPNPITIEFKFKF